MIINNIPSPNTPVHDNFHQMNDNRAANVRANMECDFEASWYGENEILYFTYACRQNIYVRSTDSERKSASSACYSAILSNARKSVGSGSVFSLSLGTFLSLYLATKEKEKYISKNFFYFKIALTFSSLLR